MADAPVQIVLPKVGDYVHFGRFKNKKGRVTQLWKDEKSGAVKIEISPIPRGRKKARQMGVLNVRLMDPASITEAKRLEAEEAKKKKTATLLALKISARFEALSGVP
jgi:ribosomal protein L24